MEENSKELNFGKRVCVMETQEHRQDICELVRPGLSDRACQAKEKNAHQ